MNDFNKLSNTTAVWSDFVILTSYNFLSLGATSTHVHSYFSSSSLFFLSLVYVHYMFRLTGYHQVYNNTIGILMQNPSSVQADLKCNCYYWVSFFLSWYIAAAMNVFSVWF
jgi:hypothetical protein